VFVKARPTQPFFYVMQKTYEKCGLHAGNMKYVTQNEEWINVCIIICIILPVYFSAYHVQYIYLYITHKKTTFCCNPCNSSKWNSHKKTVSPYIFIKTLLPLILVRSQIKNMLGGETCKDTWERILLVYNILVHCEHVNFKVTGINFMTVFIARREAACF